MTFEYLDCWPEARDLTKQKVRSLTCVIEDNYPELAVDAVELRKKAIGTGQLVGGLIRSTESRKTKLLALLSPLSSLPSPYSDERLRHLRRESRQTLPHPSQQQGGMRYKALRDVLADSTKSVGKRLWSTISAFQRFRMFSVL